MKRIVFFVLCILLSLSVCGCATTDKEVGENESVIINLAADNTVNGYRENAQTESEMPDKISGAQISIGTVSSSVTVTVPQDSIGADYCANKNSKIFHKSTCGSVKTMKEENKYISSNRNTLISEGYTPCKRCNP